VINIENLFLTFVGIFQTIIARLTPTCSVQLDA